MIVLLCFFFFQAEDGIRDLVRSRGLGDVYKRQVVDGGPPGLGADYYVNGLFTSVRVCEPGSTSRCPVSYTHLTLPTSDLV